MKYLVIYLIAYCVFSSFIAVDSLNGITYYSFTRFPYKKKPKNERKIKNVKTKCEDVHECTQAQGLEQQRCVRSCMSQMCYAEIYARDELEEGEIDVRYNSFKGCILQELLKH